MQALTELDVSGCAGAGDAFVLQMLGGRFWDVRDCLPVQHISSPADPSQTRTIDTRYSSSGSVGVGGAGFVDACMPRALVGEAGARDLLLLEQALQVPTYCTAYQACMLSHSGQEAEEAAGELLGLASAV